MKARTLPASDGLKWLIEAYLIYRRNPLLLVLMSFSFWGIVLFLELVPVLGAIASSIFTPALLVSIMNVCRDLDQKRVTPPGAIFSGFAQQRKTLFVLGALRILRMLAIILVVTLVDGGEMLSLLAQIKPTSQPTPEQLSVFLTPFYVLPFFLPVFMAFWFAPLLAAWNGLPTIKSLFFSLVACWRNWRAFMVYGLSLVILVIVLPTLAMVLFSLLVPASLAATVISVPLMIMAMPVLFASIYVSYRTIFVDSDAA